MDVENSYIKVCRESFATDEDWETVCEEVGADPKTTESVTIYIKTAIIVDKE